MTVLNEIFIYSAVYYYLAERSSNKTSQIPDLCAEIHCIIVVLLFHCLDLVKDRRSGSDFAFV